MSIKNRFKAAFTPGVTIEDLEGPDAFTPFKDVYQTVAHDIGITTRRDRDIAQQRGLEMAALTEDTDQQIASMLEGPLPAPDRAQLSTIAARYDRSKQLMGSRFQDLQAAGLGEWAQTQQQLLDWQKTQEVQAIEHGNENWTRYSSLSDDLYRESADFLSQRAALGSILAASAQSDSAGDMALIMGVMKMLDPGSTVREGEFATAQNAGGVPDIALTAYNRLLRNGERLSPEQRKEFLTLAENAYTTAREQQLERNTRYLGTGRAAGLDDVLLDQLRLPTEVPRIPLAQTGTKPGQAPAPIQASPEWTGSRFDKNRNGRIDDDEDPISVALGRFGRWLAGPQPAPPERTRGVIERPTN